MGNVGRTIYLVIPFVLTLASLVLLLIVLLNLNSATSNSFTESLYFLRVRSDNIKAVNSGKDIPVSGVAAFYDIGLFNYCSGPKANALPNFCSNPQVGYTFDLANVLRTTGIPNLVNVNEKEWTAAMNTYRSVSKFASAAYIIGFGLLALSFLLGLLTFCLSRITNMLTTIASALGTAFLVLGSAAATGVFITLKGALWAKLHQYNVSIDVGNRVLAITWLASAAALVATFLWSCGCCCGRDRSLDKGHRSRGLKSTEYERLHDPHGHSVPLQNTGPYPSHGYPSQGYSSHGYEPYRGHSVV